MIPERALVTIIGEDMDLSTVRGLAWRPEFNIALKSYRRFAAGSDKIAR
jgi:hypothetical protein